MTKYTDIKQDTPRLVVTFQRPEPKTEHFQWGMVGQLPLLSTIGYIARVQADLPLLESGDPVYECPESALVIVWDPEKMKFCYFIHKDIPVDSMIGMLEMVKDALVGTSAAQQARNQQIGLLGPDGQPMKRR